MLFVSGLLFNSYGVNELIGYFDNIYSLKVITCDDFDYSCVFNGDKYILDINKNDINSLKYEGITIKINKNSINITDFMKFFDVKVKKQYFVDNIKVIDGISKKIDINNKNTIQIAIDDDYVTIGVPMILNGF